MKESVYSDDDSSLKTLLELNGEIFPMDSGYWTKIEAHRVPPDRHIPHGVRYSVTLNDSCNNRILGFDNAHAFKPVRKNTELAKSHGTINTDMKEYHLMNMSPRVNCWKISGMKSEKLQDKKMIMNDKILKIGIISREDYQKRTLAIARGEYRPDSDEPKIWFESLQSMAQILSNENRELLKIIMKTKPGSLKELETVTGRKSSNLSRTLKLMARYGIVKLEKHSRNIRPIVMVTDFKVEFGLDNNFA